MGMDDHITTDRLPPRAEPNYTPEVKKILDRLRELTTAELLAVREGLKDDWDIGGETPGAVDDSPLAPLNPEPGLIYRDTITIEHSDFVDRTPPFDRICEEIIAVGSIPSITYHGTRTEITFEIPVKSYWEACERAHEMDVAFGSYGIFYTDPDESKVVEKPWENTCNEAMRWVYEYKQPTFDRGSRAREIGSRRKAHNQRLHDGGQ